MNYLGKIHPIFYCIIFFTLGITSGFLSVSQTYILLILACLTTSIIVTRKAVIFFLFILFFLIGYLRAESWVYLYDIPQQAEGETLLRGYVSAEPERKEYSTRITITIDNSHERLLARVPHYPEHYYGDYLQLSGELEYPKPFETDNGSTFPYDTFLKKDKIYYTVNYPEITLISQGTHGKILTSKLLLLKEGLVGQIERYLPEPHSSLLAGLLVGAKSSMGSELLDDFRITGVIHIVVLSGFNVTIIAEAIMRVLAFLGVVGSSIFGSLAILLFALMTGASATVVRASLMAFLVIIARVTGYQSEITRALFIAGFCMVLHNPMILLYDPSFQLSFLATLGLVTIVPWVEEKLVWIPKTKFDFRGLAAASLGTQIFVLPVLIYMSGEVSLVSFAVNILVLWVVPITMLIGFIMIVASLISDLLVVPVMTVTWLLLGYILTLVEWFSSIPYASIQVASLSVFGMLSVYVLYMVIWLYRKTRQA